MTTLTESQLWDNTATSTGVGGVASGGITTVAHPSGPLAVTILTESKVRKNEASASAGTAVGGLHALLVGTYVLADTKVNKNDPTNCNFADPGCVT